MTTTTIDVATIPTIGHDEAMRLAEGEYDRFVESVRALRPDDWAKPTDCTLWDVRALVGHTLGNVEAAASVPEMVRLQLRTARRAKREGVAMIDAMTAIQVEDRAALSTDALVDRLAKATPKAVKGRRRTPRLVREKLKVDLGDGTKRPLGYLIDQVFTRDVWMHRIDVARAVGGELVLTADHDGRLVADIVADWAREHGQPFDLTLNGPAGGHFLHGAGGEVLELDAVEFGRIVAGRVAGDGLLATTVLF